MKKINFTKMVASGNDFVVIDEDYTLNAIPALPARQACLPAGRRSTLHASSFKFLSRKLCDRKYGIGADGLLLLGKSKKSDIKMRIFNSDGSEAEMCGNGARCAGYVIARERSERSNLKKRDCFAPSGLAMTIETKAGIIRAMVSGENIKIKLTDPKDIRINVPIKINNRALKVNFINTGVPHVVVFTQGLDEIDVFALGRQIRHHQKFAPKGANVNFIEALDENSIKIRTYERGVEDETLACGTGSVASALLYAIRSTLPYRMGKYAPLRYPLHAIRYNYTIFVKTQSGETLKVYFRRENNKFKDVWLEGTARVVYKGVYYV